MELELGKKYYHAKVDNFRMADGTNQLEGRVNEITIEGIYQYNGDETSYVFFIGGAQLTGHKKDFYKTKEEAMEGAREIIKNITVRFEEPKPKEELKLEPTRNK